MRQLFMYLAAAGLLILAVALILRGPDKAPDPQLSTISNGSETTNRGSTRIATETDHPSPTHSTDSAEASSSRPTPESAAVPGTASRASANRMADPALQSRNNATSNAPGSRKNSVATAPAPDSEQVADDVLAETPLPAVRLAQDVPLPAVIIALHTEQNDPENPKPQPIKDAMKAIVDTFYEDLAKAAAAGEHVSLDPDGTHVIGKGPAVDNARDRANDIYRALFGIEAYNQMTSNAVLEAQLPPTE